MQVLNWTQHRGAWILILNLLSVDQSSLTFHFIIWICQITCLDFCLHIFQVTALHAFKIATILNIWVFLLLFWLDDAWYLLGFACLEPLSWPHSAIKLIQELLSQQFNVIYWFQMSLIGIVLLHFQNWVLNQSFQLKVDFINLQL